MHDHLFHECHRLLPIIICSESERRIAILERQHLGRGGGILWPREAGCVCRVEMVDEIDEVVSHISWAEDVGDVGSMVLYEDISHGTS